MIIILRHLVPRGYSGITLFPFIVLTDQRLKRDLVILNHERIHLRQQMELLVVFFYLWYGIEFLVKWLKLRDQRAAYKSISFEREAYAHEADMNYLKERPFWNFIRYF